MAKTMWKKIVVAGPLVMESIYPAVNGHDLPRERGAKRNLSSEAQRRMNAKYSYQKLELMLAANFVPGDLVLTLTYDDAHLPVTRKEAEARLKAFRARLSADRKAAGGKLVMFWCTESRHGDGRYHHHAVINAFSGSDYERILALWAGGSDTEIRPLELTKERNYLTLARYMCKEEREKLGLRVWHYTRNAKKPETETFRVEADTVLQIPHGAIAIDEASERTEFGRYRYIKYIGSSRIPRRRVKAKRRRRARS